LEKSNKEVVNCEAFQFGGIGKKNSFYNMPTSCRQAGVAGDFVATLFISVEMNLSTN
jgi:hypothetical protein